LALGTVGGGGGGGAAGANGVASDDEHELLPEPWESPSLVVVGGIEELGVVEDTSFLEVWVENGRAMNSFFRIF
jgi:D-serine dehydratase